MLSGCLVGFYFRFWLLEKILFPIFWLSSRTLFSFSGCLVGISSLCLVVWLGFLSYLWLSGGILVPLSGCLIRVSFSFGFLVQESHWRAAIFHSYFESSTRSSLASPPSGGKRRTFPDEGGISPLSFTFHSSSHKLVFAS